MLKVALLHNSKSGDEAHSAKRLVKQIEQKGYACYAISTQNNDWQPTKPDTDFIAVAGGDGTVRQTAIAMLSNTAQPNMPIAILPSGTANNIATSLRIEGNPEEVIKSWKSCEKTPVDAGTVTGITGQHFFIESLGFGVLPRLMQAMEKLNQTEFDNPDLEIQAAKNELYGITLAYEPHYCKVVIDGQDYSGEYLLIEVLNISFVGPNLHLAPMANPSDGELEVMLVPKDKRDEFAEYIRLHKDTDTAQNYFFKPIKGRNIQLQWTGQDAHIDDVYMQLNEHNLVNISVNPGALVFLL